MIREHGKLAANFSWLILAQLGSKSTSLVALVFLARYLGDAEFGRYAVALAVPAAIEALADLGLSQALVREGAGQPDRTRRLAIAVAPAKALLAATSVGLTYLLAVQLRLPSEIVETALYLGIAKAFESMNYLARAVFQANERMEFEAASLGFDSIVRLVFLIYALASGFGILGLAKALALASLVVLAATFVVATHRFLLPWPRDAALPLRVIAGGIPFAVVWLLESLYLRAAILATGAILGDAAAGVFAAATRLVEPLLIVPGMMAAALLPLATRHVLEERDTLPWLVHASLKMALLFALASGISLIGLAPVLVPAVFGPEFVEAVGPVRVLALALVPWSIQVPLTALLLAFRSHATLIGGQLAGVAVTIASLPIAIPAWGVAGAAASVALGQATTLGIVLMIDRDIRHLGAADSLRSIRATVPAVVAVALGPVVGEVPATLLALILLFAAIRLFRDVDEREIAYLLSIAPQAGRIGRLLLAPIGGK